MGHTTMATTVAMTHTQHAAVYSAPGMHGLAWFVNRNTVISLNMH